MRISDREYFIDDILEIRNALKHMEETAISAGAYEEWEDAVTAMEDFLEIVRHG